MSDLIYQERELEEIDSVWVIEAPGKIRHMKAVLESLGYKPEIVATRGHFIKMPEGLDKTGIDSDMTEFAREANPDVVLRLNEAISRLPEEDGRVYIATDADMEGDVIAVDVYDTIEEMFPSAVRVKLKGLDKTSIQEAIDDATPIDRSEAIPGRTRAVVDRLIGAGFARKGIAAGRVRSAILGLVAKGNLTPYKLFLEAPSQEGAAPWTVSTNVVHPLNHEVAHALAQVKFPPLEEGRKEFIVSPPDDMGRIMVKAGDSLDMSPADTASAMQSAYESGRLSYPRSDVQALSEAAASKVSSSFRKSGQQFKRNIVKIKGLEDVHDSPYPIGDFNINHDPEALGASEGIRVLIGRNLLKAGQQRKTSFHVKGPIEAHLKRLGFSEEIAQFIDNLTWVRDMGPRIPGDDVKQGVVTRRPDTVLLEACVDSGLGRPSTYAKHIQQFMEQNLIGPDMRLTQVGRDLAARTPKIMMDPNLSKAIEMACKVPTSAVAGKEAWQVLAGKIVANLPAELKQTMTSAMEKKPEVSTPAHTLESNEGTSRIKPSFDMG